MRRVTGFNRLLVVLVVAAVCLPFFEAGLAALTGKNQQYRLEGAFHWAKKSYLDGRYRTAEKKLKRLVSFLDGGNGSVITHKNLLRRTLLLLVEVSEKIGRKKAADSYLQRAQALIAKLKE
jgi:hypothetical protein